MKNENKYISIIGFDLMKYNWLISLCILLILINTMSGCMENKDNIEYNKNLDLIYTWVGYTIKENPTSDLDFFKSMLLSQDDYQLINSSDEKSIHISTGVGNSYPYNLYQFKYDNKRL